MFAFKSTKKYLFFIFLLTAVLFSGCASNGDEPEPVRLINAENYDGAEIISPPPLEIPPLPPENTTTSQTIITTTTEPTITTTTTTNVGDDDPVVPITTTTPPTITTTTPTITTTTPAVTTTTPAPVVTTTPALIATPPAAASGEVVGVWISFIELQTAFAGRTEASFRAAFAEMMSNCKSLGINTVYVHVRGHGDAYYKSELFPWAKQITGTMGTAPAFDPLEIMIEEAHSRGISFRAWLNPMRLMTDADMKAVSASNPALPVSKWYSGAENGTRIFRVGEHWYLNPAYAEVRQLIADGAAEILRNYKVDGIHIDDYFYPPNSGTAFDSAAFAASSFSDLSAFRLDNSTRMVKALYDTVKSINSSVLFGISPQGSIQNCYEIYADVRKWASQAGYCDYIAPQLYYGFLNAAQPFERCLAEWEDLVRGTNIKLIIGLASYKLGQVDNWAGEAGKNEWITDRDTIIGRQIEAAKKAGNYGGYIYFSYRFL